MNANIFLWSSSLRSCGSMPQQTGLFTRQRKEKSAKNAKVANMKAGHMDTLEFRLIAFSQSRRCGNISAGTSGYPTKIICFAPFAFFADE